LNSKSETGATNIDLTPNLLCNVSAEAIAACHIPKLTDES